MTKYKVLHICNNYWANSLYSKMIASLADYKHSFHEVFVPIRNKDQNNNNNLDLPNVKVNYRLVATHVLYRIFFRLKTVKAFKQLRKSSNLNQFSIIHAHTMFSDGALCLKILKQTKIKYIITVRNTDINIVLKYIPLLRKKGEHIITNASAIVFISPSYVDKLIHYYPKIKDNINQKQIILPNGINRFWLDNANPKTLETPKNKVHLVFAGEITPNKNVKTIIQAVNKINADHNTFNVELTIVGRGKNDNKTYLRQIETLAKNNTNITILDAVSKEDLLKIYRKNHIFIMPSLTETFGLVYAEALSQSLPVIYTKNEGFYGFFNEGEVGYSVNNPKSVEDVCDSIHKVVFNFNNIQLFLLNTENKFSWSCISAKYNELYKNTLSD